MRRGLYLPRNIEELKELNALLQGYTRTHYYGTLVTFFFCYLLCVGGRGALRVVRL